MERHNETHMHMHANERGGVGEGTGTAGALSAGHRAEWHGTLNSSAQTDAVVALAWQHAAVSAWLL